MNWPPVVIPSSLPLTGNDNVLIQNFVRAATADEQLGTLKNILKIDEPLDRNTVELLVVVFFHSEAKHPIKCFLTRYITKNKHLQEPFTEQLTSHINALLNKPYVDDWKYYSGIVPKLSMCIENFPPGTMAVNNVKRPLARNLSRCLNECSNPSHYHPLSPMEKSQMYAVVHVALKLLLHIMTKNPLSKSTQDIREKHASLLTLNQVLIPIHELLEDKDLPMDTKCLCGIVIVAYEQKGYWLHFLLDLFASQKDDQYQLAMLSAVVSTVPMRQLEQTIGEPNVQSLITILVTKLLEIVDRSPSDGVISLGVARALHQVSKALENLPLELGVGVMRQVCTFVWSHLDHYMCSVRYLAAEILSCLVQYCACIQPADNGAALESVLVALRAVGVARRGYYAGVRGAARGLSAARVLARVAPLAALLRALAHPHLAATVTATLDDLLKRHSRETEAGVIHQEWVLPILVFVQSEDLEVEVLSALENLLATAVKLNPGLGAFILPHIKQACESPDPDLKNVMVSLNVVRASFADEKQWRALVSCDILERAVVDAEDKIRLQALSLLCSGNWDDVTSRDCEVVLRFLRYNINAHSPHFRQKALALLKKFIKRVEDEYRTAKRKGCVSKERCCQEFLEACWGQCFASLLPLASYGRRCVALTLTQQLALSADRTWKEEYVDKLLVHLDDSYESNKVLALNVLQHCPLALLQDKEYSVSLELEDIIRQAAALKPAECVSAAYKLQLLHSRLAAKILRGHSCEAKEPAMFILVRELYQSLEMKLPYRPSMARDNPNYGLLHCVRHLLDRLPTQAMDDCRWRKLIGDIIDRCRVLIDRWEWVVCNAAPEGVLPAADIYVDMGTHTGVQLEDGRLLTPQTVLLVAWRTVMEACMVLGAIGSRLADGPMLDKCVERLACVVGQARHRGALEQAYQAYEQVLTRMWRNFKVHHIPWPKMQLKSTLAWLRSADPFSKPADRRSAGLPFLIQALVSTEPSCRTLGEVMSALLQLARTPDSRAHACNILRALYRAASLDTAVQGYVGEGLCVALEGFDGNTWEERNSSTLLFSALLTRVFGVSASRATVSARNRMTGHVFFTRYPRLYDLMLNMLKAVSTSEIKLLSPSLFPVLLLLARLYPSSLEGTESNLKLVSFIPWVVRCARSRVLVARRLAAAAGVSLVSPHSYIGHLEYLFGLISEPRVERNFCHGIMLQICALLEERPAEVDASPLRRAVCGTLWVCAQARGALPCYPLLHQYVLTLRLLLLRFPEIMEREFVEEVKNNLWEIVFAAGGSGVARALALGREPCLHHCVLLLPLLHQGAHSTHHEIPELIIRALSHDVCEVRDAALEYMLDTSPAAGSVSARGGVRARTEYVPLVCAPLANPDLWRTQPHTLLKHLQLLVAEGRIKEVLTARPSLFCRNLNRGVDGIDGTELCYRLVELLGALPERALPVCVDAIAACLHPPEHLHIQELSNCVWKVCSVAVPGETRECRAAVARLLRRSAAPLLLAADALIEGDQPLLTEVSILCAVWLLLADEESGIRDVAAATAAAITHTTPGSRGEAGARAAVPALCGARLLRAVGARRRAVPLLVALALHDTEPPHLVHEHATPQEYRVFDGNEQANVYLEETVTARECGALIADTGADTGADACARVTDALRMWPVSQRTGDNGRAFLKLANGEQVAANPKVQLFLDQLRLTHSE